MSADWTRDLATALGDCDVVTDADIVEAHARDQAPLAPVGVATALVRARTVEHVLTTLRFANERQIPVVTRAAGTGLAGGANAVDGCILLGVAALDQIRSIDPVSRLAVVEPGVLNGTLASEAARLGLYYAPDPASREISTIGGNIATNAGGACCMKYGVTGDHVAALKVALADGTVITTGALTRKNVAGLDLTRLIVGSEGILGVIVEATVRLLPAPRPSSTLLAFFQTLEQAGAALVALVGRGDLTMLELMDQVTLAAVEERTEMGLDTTAAACLIAQCDAEGASAIIAACADTCRAHGADNPLCTDDPEEGRMLLSARRMALPALERKGTTLLDDVAVPIPALPEMLRRIRNTAERHGVLVATFGHAGDGNLHPTFVFDGTDPEAIKRVNAAFAEIVGDAIALGGSLSGEHGVGSLKTPYMDAVGVEERALMRRIKLAFDPRGILNPGKGI